MNHKNKKAFTLVELNQIKDGLDLTYLKTNSFPEPDNFINIMSGSKVLSNQGYVSGNILTSINSDSKIIDPLDKIYYTYSTSNYKNEFQLLAMLEKNDIALNVIDKTYALDYNNRYPYTIGSKIGIILDEDNIPAQINNSSGSLDISQNITYKKIIPDEEIIAVKGGSGISNPITNLAPETCFIFDSNSQTITNYTYINYCPLYYLIIPDKIGGVDVKNIGNRAFQGMYFIGVVIPNSVTSIGDRAFNSN